MKAIVVYESLWGSTAAIARAIAEGIGPEAQALSTAEAAADVVASADLVVAQRRHGSDLARAAGRRLPPGGEVIALHRDRRVRSAARRRGGAGAGLGRGARAGNGVSLSAI